MWGRCSAEAGPEAATTVPARKMLGRSQTSCAGDRLEGRAVANYVFVGFRPPTISWVPEGSLAGIFWRHNKSLALVCGVDFWCHRHYRMSPVLLEGSDIAP